MISRGGSVLQNIPPVVKNLILINVIMWIACVVFQSSFQIRIEDYLGLHYFGAEAFKPWQLLTYMFLHAYSNMSLSHLFFNMFALYMFGRTLEQVWGPKRFLVYYLITGVGAAIIQQLVQFIELRPIVNELNDIMNNFPADGVNIGGRHVDTVGQLVAFKMDYLNQFVTVGASGSVFGILLAFGMLFPNAQLMLLIPPIPIKAKYFVMIYGAIELFAGLAPTQGDNVAHFAHLGGMLFGYFLIKYWRKDTKQFF